jgi:Ion transport protein
MLVLYGDALQSKFEKIQEKINLFTFVLNSLFETTQTLFWAAFGLIDLDSFELDGIKIFTRFWGMLMFGCYSVINIVVLLNLLIAMMNHSYQLISVSFS